MDKGKGLLLRSAVLYYAKCLKLKARIDDTLPIGFPLQAFFPQLPAAIEAGSPGTGGQSPLRKEALKNILCLKHGIALVRILGPGEKAFGDGACRYIQMGDWTEGTMEEAVSRAFELIGRETDVDFARDRNAIKEMARSLSDDETSDTDP